MSTEKPKIRYKLIILLAFLVYTGLRGIYVAYIIGIDEYADIYTNENGMHQIVVSSTERTSSGMAETPLARVFLLIEQILFHPTVDNDVIFCSSSIEGIQDITEIKVLAFGSKAIGGAFEYKKLAGNISFENNKLNIDLKHATIASGSHYLLNRDGTFKFNGKYKLRKVESKTYANAKCN